MTTKKNSAAPPAPPGRAALATASEKSGRLFSSRKTGDSAITHERIAADLEDFQKAGGKIEVLGTTRVPSPSEPKPKPGKPKR